MANNSPSETEMFQATAVFHGIKFLLETGTPIALAYDERNLARAAATFTGINYSIGNLKDAEADLRLWFSDICGITIDDVPIEYARD